MVDQFFEKPILNSPYAYPGRHWELDDSGQPTNRIIDSRRRAEFITPIPKPKKRLKRCTSSYMPTTPRLTHSSLTTIEIPTT